MGQETVELDVIILNWNASDDTCACLRKLAGWHVLQPHIYVVDNCSADNSAEVIAAEFPGVELIQNPVNGGFSGGNNVALRAIMDSRSEDNEHDQVTFILLLNNDAFIEENQLAVLIKTMVENPDMGVAGPLLFKEEGYGELLSAGGLDPSENTMTYWAGETAEAFTAQVGNAYEVDYVSGTVALLRRSVVREVGLFDEEYFFSCEMADLCERIKQRDSICTIHPEVKAWHDMQSPTKSRDTLYLYYSLRNRFLFIRKFRPDRRTKLFGYWLMIGGRGMLKSLFVGRFATVRALFLALYDGLTGRYGGRNELFIDVVE